MIFFFVCFLNQLTSVGLKENDVSLLRLNTVYVVTGYRILSFIEIVSFFIGPLFDIIMYEIYYRPHVQSYYLSYLNHMYYTL